MFERGEIGFVFLWILNPIVILFYQNCSSIPASQVDLVPPPTAALTQPLQQPTADAQPESSRVPSCVYDIESGRCIE